MNATRCKYYLNTTPHAERLVHREDCIYLPSADSRIYLGEFYSPLAAVVEALKRYPTADSCHVCKEQ